MLVHTTENFPMKRFWNASRLGMAALASIALLGGCASVTPMDYRGEKPTLKLEHYFNGPLTADGIVFNRAGKAVRRFHVDMVGVWHGGEGTLTENFTYSNGAKQVRVWTLRRVPGEHGERRYQGTAADVAGTASGYAEGNAFNWRYTLLLPVGGTTYHVQMDDWMYQMDEHVLLNRTVMTKFGFEVASIFIAFHKP